MIAQPQTTMVLSQTKINEYIQTKGFVVERWFVSKNTHFIHAYSSKTGIPILISFRQPVEHVTNACQLHYVQVPDVDSVEAFIHREKPVMEDELPELQALPPGTRTIASHMDVMYSSDMTLQDAAAGLESATKVCVRQIRRLMHCVQATLYSLSCIHTPRMSRDSVVVVGSDTSRTIDAFTARAGLLDGGQSLMLVTMELRVFYDRSNTVGTEIATVMQAVHKVLNTTQKSHITHLGTLVYKYQTLVTRESKLQEAKSKFDEYIQKYTELLGKYELESDAIAADLEFERGGMSGNSATGTIQRGSRVMQLETQMSSLNKKRNEILSIVCKTRMRHDMLALEIDNALFHNVVMLDSVMRNLDMLAELEKVIFEKEL